MNVWTYVITVDDGGAPNFEPPSTTLALCKPRIRSGAKPGNLVLAFTGRRLSRNSRVPHEPNQVWWAGVVKESLPFADYWRDPRFRDKRPDRAKSMPDNIYRPSVTGFEQISNEKHKPGEQARDLSGKNVLVFGQIWRLGPMTPALPARFGLNIVGSRRGHRVGEIAETAWQHLKRWLDQNAPKASANSDWGGLACTAHSATPRRAGC